MTALDVLIEEKLSERAQRLGEQFRRGIRSIRSPLVKEVRGRGLFNAVVIDESASSRGRTAWQFCLLLKSRGVLAKPTHVNMYVVLFRIGERDADDLLSQSIRFSPPLVISEEDLQNAIEVIRQALIDLDQVRGRLLPLLRYLVQTSLLTRSSFLFCSSRIFLERWRARRVSGMNSVTEGIHPPSLVLQLFLNSLFWPLSCQLHGNVSLCPIWISLRSCMMIPHRQLRGARGGFIRESWNCTVSQAPKSIRSNRGVLRLPSN
jgi:hypothetical protein